MRQLRQAWERHGQAQELQFCRLVKYCGVECQKTHRQQHKKACKQRAGELKEEQLYSQGIERPEGDFCPICTLPIPLPMGEYSVFSACCMKRICKGCDWAAQKRGMHDCPFCRTTKPKNDADMLAMIQARVEKNDPEATSFLGEYYCYGLYGLQSDMHKATKLWEEASELGSTTALDNLGDSYFTGRGVQNNWAKAAEYYAKAAMQGSVLARNNLGVIEGNRWNHDRAVRHYLISAKMGLNDSVEGIKDMFMRGLATKEQYARALQGYQDAVEEMKSPERDEAKRLGFVWK